MKSSMEEQAIKTKTYDIERFPGQRAGEQVRLILVKHWVIYVRMLKKFIFFAFVPMVFGLFMMDDVEPITMDLIYLFSFIYLSYFFLVLFVQWLDYMLDLIIITSERVVSIDQVNIFQNTSSETSLTLVQDVRASKKGLFGNILHYGKLTIQTAGEKIVFEMDDVPDPYGAAKTILDLRDAAVKKENTYRFNPTHV